MSDFNRGFSPISAGRADMAVDAGLRSFMLGVYNKVGLGLVVSAALAYATSAVPAVRDLLYVTTPDGRLAGVTVLGMAVSFAPLVAVLIGMFAITPRPSASIYYWTIVALVGAGLGYWACATPASVASTFLIKRAAFGRALGLAGYTTKKDLTGFGSFLIVGLVEIGLVIAMLVSMFFPIPGLVFAINVLGVFIFAGLIAYDTQRLKMSYYQLQFGLPGGPDQLRRPEPLPRLHQPVHVPAAHLRGARR